MGRCFMAFWYFKYVQLFKKDKWTEETRNAILQSEFNLCLKDEESESSL